MSKLPESLDSKSTTPKKKQSSVRVAHSKSEYKRITAQGGKILPPLSQGQIWLKNGPSDLFFTDDAGVDHNISAWIGKINYEAYKEAHRGHPMFEHMDDWDDLQDEHKVAWTAGALSVEEAFGRLRYDQSQGNLVSKKAVDAALAALRKKGT